MASLRQTSRFFTLNSGHQMPAVGLGTWLSHGAEARAAVEAALRVGYRHIDTAAEYGNEAEVGAGIRDSGVPRDRIWLTSKLANPDHRGVAAALDRSLERLGTPYLDLFLMHWPSSTDPADPKRHLPDWDFRDTWREMQKLAGSEKVRSIGVSNFDRTNLDKLLRDPACKLVPAVNQIELHPGHPSPELVALNTSKGIHTTGYSCLGSRDSPLYRSATLLAISEAKAKTPQQVLLMWGLQKGWSVIPKSVTPARIEANFQLDGWSLSEDEVKAIDGICKAEGSFKVCDDAWLPYPVFDDKPGQ